MTSSNDRERAPEMKPEADARRAARESERRSGAGGIAERRDDRDSEARRASGVGVTHKSEEVGEPTRGTQRSKGVTGSTEPREGNATGMQGLEGASTKVSRIAELARKHPEWKFSSLHQVIDEEFLREAHRRTRKDGARGVDGEGAAEFAEQLPERLRELREELVSGSYRAPAVRRVHIPKGDGDKTRPIGIPTFEDKVLQRAVAMVVSAVYEQDFLPCSYGYRPRRSAHGALGAVREGLMAMDGGYVVELDIERFFDTLDHGTLRRFLDRRVTDGVLRRAIDKWLAAGVLENGSVSYPDEGTPQGGVISPLLANIYLHEVLDVWFEQEVKPRLRGRGFMVRYADDAVLAFEREEDALRVLAVLPKRFERFGLRLHPEKTRLVNFKRPRLRGGGGRAGAGTGDPGSFDFLGLTQHWARSRKNYWVIKRRTAKDRFARSVRRVKLWCKQHRHDSVVEQHKALSAKLHGHYAYFGITGNQHALARFYEAVTWVWRKWLSRRSAAAHRAWSWFASLRERLPLPPPIAVHSTLRRSAKP